MLMTMRLCEPSVVMATGNGETTPLMVGFSNSSALPPPGNFISRSAISVISSSVATGWEMRFSSPALSRALTKSRKESKAIRRGWQKNARLAMRGIISKFFENTSDGHPLLATRRHLRHALIPKPSLRFSSTAQSSKPSTFDRTQKSAFKNYKTFLEKVLAVSARPCYKFS
jgi:hypothetical protein